MTSNAGGSAEYFGDNANAILQQLGERSKKRREQALVRLAPFPVDSILDLLIRYHALDHEARSESSKSSSVRMVIELVGASIVVAAIGISSCTSKHIMPGAGVGILAIMGAAMYGGYVRLRDSGISYRYDTVTRLLCLSQSSQAVAPLCDYLDSRSGKPETEIQETIRAALTRLLPMYAARRMEMPDPRRRRAIHRELCRLIYLDFYSHADPSLTEADRAYAISLLQFIEGIGDTSNLRAVENFYDRHFRREHNTEMVRQARRCLSRLRELSEAGTGREVLLRGSANPGDGSDLIRPAATPPEEPESLLRPAESANLDEQGPFE